jgi:hypothetical protein
MANGTSAYRGDTSFIGFSYSIENADMALRAQSRLITRAALYQSSGASIIVSAAETNQTEKCKTEKWRLLFFCLTFFCLVDEMTINAIFGGWHISCPAHPIQMLDGSSFRYQLTPGVEYLMMLDVSNTIRYLTSDTQRLTSSKSKTE